MSDTLTFSAGVLITLACVLSVILNTLALVVFCKRKRLRRRAHLIPLFHLAAVDLLAVVTWSALSITIAITDWSPPAALCQAHAYFRSFWNMLHVHTLAVLAIERALRLVRPSRHVTIFEPRVVAFLLAGVWVFDAIVASVPHYGWLEIRLVAAEMQCAPDYTASTETLDFDFSVKWGLPYLLLMAPCFAGAFLKVRAARGQASSSGEILLETNAYSDTNAYTQRLADFQNRFKQIGTKSAKPKLGEKEFTADGYVTDSDSDVNDASGPELRAPRKVFSLARREYVLLKTYVIIACLYLLLWLPHVAVTFVVNYDPLDTPVADWLRTLVTCLTHCPQFVLPAVYLSHNRSFRRSVVKTLLGCKRR